MQKHSVSDHLLGAALDYMSKRQDTILRPHLSDFFMHWNQIGGRYWNGYPCSPCPNCTDEVMWYRESTWRYDADGHIDHNGMHCERCGHTWNDRTGEVWEQGQPRDQVWNMFRQTDLKG